MKDQGAGTFQPCKANAQAWIDLTLLADIVHLARSMGCDAYSLSSVLIFLFQHLQTAAKEQYNITLHTDIVEAALYLHNERLLPKEIRIPRNYTTREEVLKLKSNQSSEEIAKSLYKSMELDQ